MDAVVTANVSASPAPWRYTITPELVINLTRVASAAGELRAVPLSYYRQRDLATRAKRERIARNVRHEYGATTTDEVDAVMQGARLGPRRQAIEDAILREALLEDAFAYYTESLRRERRLDASTAVAYRDCALGELPRVAPTPYGLPIPAPRWDLLHAREASRLLDTHRVTREVPASVQAIFDWADQDPLLAHSPVLRAAAIYWRTSRFFPTWHSAAVLLRHEFRVARIDVHALLALTDVFELLRELVDGRDARAAHEGVVDFTEYFEAFAGTLGALLENLLAELGRVRSNESRLPWAVPAPADELDARLYAVVERLGRASSAAIMEALGPDAPPLRTVQRRLQKLVGDHVLTRYGARKNAVYAPVVRG